MSDNSEKLADLDGHFVRGISITDFDRIDSEEAVLGLDNVGHNDVFSAIEAKTLAKVLAPELYEEVCEDNRLSRPFRALGIRTPFTGLATSMSHSVRATR